MTTKFNRRIRLDLATPMEAAISAALQAVESGPPDIRLTEAVNLLAQAREKVSEYVNEQLRETVVLE